MGVLKILSPYMKTFLALTEGNDLPLKAVLRKYLQFTYKYFLLLPPFTGVTFVNFCFLNNPGEKITRIKIRQTCWPNTTADDYVPENIRQSLQMYVQYA
jgi:hypothetical protein